MEDQSVTIGSVKKQSTWQWLVRGAVLTALGFAGVFWLGHTAHAFDPQPDPPGFGLVGITNGQTMRLGVTCSQDNNSDSDLPPDPCKATLMFHDVTGKVVKSLDVNLNPGQATFLDLEWSEISLSRGQMWVEIMPRLILAHDSGLTIPSVQVFDQSGKTIVTQGCWHWHPTWPKGWWHFHPLCDLPE